MTTTAAIKLLVKEDPYVTVATAYLNCPDFRTKVDAVVNWLLLTNQKITTETGNQPFDDRDLRADGTWGPVAAHRLHQICDHLGFDDTMTLTQVYRQQKLSPVKPTFRCQSIETKPFMPSPPARQPDSLPDY